MEALKNYGCDDQQSRPLAQTRPSNIIHAITNLLNAPERSHICCLFFCICPTSTASWLPPTVLYPVLSTLNHYSSVHDATPIIVHRLDCRRQIAVLYRVQRKHGSCLESQLLFHAMYEQEQTRRKQGRRCTLEARREYAHRD